jgi:hypothetical protein
MSEEEPSTAIELPSGAPAADTNEIDNTAAPADSNTTASEPSEVAKVSVPFNGSWTLWFVSFSHANPPPCPHNSSFLTFCPYVVWTG